MATIARREVVKINIPGDAPPWFQAVTADLTKTLDRMQQQIDELANRIEILEAQP